MTQLSSNYKVMYDQACIVIARQKIQIADLQALNVTKDKLLEEASAAVKEMKNQMTDWRWHKRLESASLKRASRGEKTTISTLRDIYNEVPHAANGEFIIHIKATAARAGLSERALQYNLDSAAEKKFISLRRAGNGLHGSEYREALYVSINQQILDNPDKGIKNLVPNEREEKRGGFRKHEDKSSLPEMICPNCYSSHTRGSRHDVGLCDDCERTFDIWIDFPLGIDESIVNISDDKYVVDYENKRAWPERKKGE